MRLKNRNKNWKCNSKYTQKNKIWKLTSIDTQDFQQLIQEKMPFFPAKTYFLIDEIQFVEGWQKSSMRFA